MDNILSLFSKKDKEKRQEVDYVCSVILNDGSIIEMVYNPEGKETKFAVFKDEEVTYQKSIKLPNGKILKPIPSERDIIKNNVVLFPAKAEEYESDEELFKGIQEFIHKYVQFSPSFEKIATYYVPFTWVYDRFNELPYLKLLGDWGTGKSRAEKTIGSISYKPIFAGGAITSAPIFRILQEIKGTFIIDEADFKNSEAWSDIVKILNCGFERQNPVLRCVGKEHEPKGFNIFGPKIIASRHLFEDQAFESRCITEEMEKKTRDDIPINLPDEFWKEATQIRNKLLMWRFRNLKRTRLNPKLEDKSIEPRLNQILIPLLSIIEDEKIKNELRVFVREYDKQLLFDRGMQIEADIVEIIDERLKKGEPTMKEIAENLNEKYGYNDLYYHGKRFTARQIGESVRKDLRLHLKRTGKGFVVPFTEREKIIRLKAKFGLKEDLEERSQEELQREADELEKEHPEEFGGPEEESKEAGTLKPPFE